MKEIINENLEYISYTLAAAIVFSPYVLKKWYGKSYIASITITLGIFGTFFGVFIGLLNFNSDLITESVPLLIDGLQTAFVTSLAGLLANLILRISPSIYGFKKENVTLKSDNIGEQIVESLNKLSNSIAGDGESTLVTQIQKLRTTNVDGFSDSNKKMELMLDKTDNVNSNILKLTNLIAGEDEATLVTQIQKLRTSNADGFGLMKTSFEEFAEKVVADNTQSLIDALAQVMRDFNSKINEQFGENFKKLNEAVTSMVVWQDEYKNHVESLMSKFSQISDNIKGVDSSLERTAKSHSEITEMNGVLNNLVKDFSLEVNSFAEIGAKAKEAFPVIESNMNNLVVASQKYISDNIDNLSIQYNSFTDKQNSIVESYGKRLNEFDEIASNNFKKHKNNQEDLITKLSESIKGTIENLENQYQNFSNSQENILSVYTKKLDEFSDSNETNFERYSLRQEELSNSYNKTISEMINGNAERIQKLDAELGQELNKALESLGSNLTSLSQHFVKDYQPLTESLKRVVEISRDIER